MVSSKSFGKRLNETMLKSGKTTKVLASEVGVSISYISAMRKGTKGPPSLETAIKIASKLNESVVWLWGGFRMPSEEILGGYIGIITEPTYPYEIVSTYCFDTKQELLDFLFIQTALNAKKDEHYCPTSIESNEDFEAYFGEPPEENAKYKLFTEDRSEALHTYGSILARNVLGTIEWSQHHYDMNFQAIEDFEIILEKIYPDKWVSVYENFSFLDQMYDSILPDDIFKPDLYRRRAFQPEIIDSLPDKWKNIDNYLEDGLIYMRTVVLFLAISLAEFKKLNPNYEINLSFPEEHVNLVNVVFTGKGGRTDVLQEYLLENEESIFGGYDFDIDIIAIEEHELFKEVLSRAVQEWNNEKYPFFQFTIEEKKKELVVIGKSVNWEPEKFKEELLEKMGIPACHSDKFSLIKRG